MLCLLRSLINMHLPALQAAKNTLLFDDTNNTACQHINVWHPQQSQIVKISNQPLSSTIPLVHTFFYKPTYTRTNMQGPTTVILPHMYELGLINGFLYVEGWGLGEGERPSICASFPLKALCKLSESYADLY